MKQHTLAVAVLAFLGSFGVAAHAAPKASTGITVSSSTPTSITYTFTDLTLDGYQFTQLAGSLTSGVVGTLTGVSVNATLSNSVDLVYASDLTLYVAYPPLDFGGLLQVGSVGDLGASETIPWANGDSDAPGTTVIDSVTLATPLTFTGGSSDPDIWLGNGYSYVGDESGTWTGSITLNGVSAVAAVPEPETLQLFLAGGAGLLAWAARRRRPAAAAC